MRAEEKLPRACLPFSGTLPRRVFLRYDIGIAESTPEKLYSKKTNESIAVLEGFAKTVSFHLLAAESIALAVKYGVHLHKPMFESIAIADEVAKDLWLHKFEQVALAEAASRIFYARPTFQEAISVAEQVFKNAETLKKENVALYDTVIEACRAVMSNIAITEGGMSLLEFEEATQSAPGYTPFIDFKVGEYEYKEALVRLVVEAVVEQLSPVIEQIARTERLFGAPLLIDMQIARAALLVASQMGHGEIVL